MQAGRLRHRVTLQSPVYGRDDQQQTLITGYMNERTVWANVVPLAGREYSDDAAVVGETQYRVEMRWQPDLAFDSAWRLLYGDRILNFDSKINIDERKREVTLFCRETAT